MHTLFLAILSLYLNNKKTKNKKTNNYVHMLIKNNQNIAIYRYIIYSYAFDIKLFFMKMYQYYNPFLLHKTKQNKT